MHLDVGIVGCGTAGAAAALFLSRAGHRVTVYEAVEAPSAVGAGIMIQPTGMYVLARLGLLDAVLARGARVGRLHCVTRARKTVLDLHYADLHPSAFGLGLHRGVLLGTLRDALMCLACKLPYVRTRMIRTMCGLERGVLLPEPLPLPRLEGQAPIPVGGEATVALTAFAQEREPRAALLPFEETAKPLRAPRFAKNLK